MKRYTGNRDLKCWFITKQRTFCIHAYHTVCYFVFVFHRQYLSPCAAEVTITGFGTVRSIPSNYTPAVSLQRTGRLFIGGLPLRFPPYKVRVNYVWGYFVWGYPNLLNSSVWYNRKNFGMDSFLKSLLCSEKKLFIS